MRPPHDKRERGDYSDATPACRQCGRVELRANSPRIRALCLAGCGVYGFRRDLRVREAALLKSIGAAQSNLRSAQVNSSSHLANYSSHKLNFFFGRAQVLLQLFCLTCQI